MANLGCLESMDFQTASMNSSGFHVGKKNNLNLFRERPLEHKQWLYSVSQSVWFLFIILITVLNTEYLKFLGID